MNKALKMYFAAAVVALTPVMASSATVDITVQEFGGFGNLSDPTNDPDIASALAARDAFIGGATIKAFEDFEDFTACPADGGCSSTAGGLATDVGEFTAFGKTGSGDSVVGPSDEAVIRNAGNGQNKFGRYNVGADSSNTHEGGNWLDSNDMQGIQWTTESAGVTFGRLAFFLTDVNDTGNLSFRILADGQEAERNLTWIKGAETNGQLVLVTMQFSESISDMLLRLNNAGSFNGNDGYGVGTATMAAVPLPAGGLLLLTALGGLAAARRKRKAA